MQSSMSGLADYHSIDQLLSASESLLNQTSTHTPASKSAFIILKYMYPHIEVTKKNEKASIRVRVVQSSTPYLGAPRPTSKAQLPNPGITGCLYIRPSYSHLVHLSHTFPSLGRNTLQLP